MKILFSTYKSAMQAPGGGEVVILKLQQYLLGKGIHVDLFNMWEHKFSNYDLIREFTTFNWDLWYLYKKMGIPFVVTPTMFPSTNPIKKLKYQTSVQLKKITQLSKNPYCMDTALSYPKLFLPTTQIESDRLQYFYNLPSSQFKVLSNGVDDLRKIDAKIPPGFPLNDYLLFVGNISPIKKLDHLIKVAKKLKKHLVVVGEGHPEHQHYTNYCQSISNEFIHFVGKIPNGSPELVGLYKNARCIVIPSEFETCSLVGLEAGILAKPVVITEIGGTKEVYQNLVHYHHPKNTESLSTSIFKAWDKGGIDLKLQDHILKNYTWDKIADDLIHHYRWVVGHGQ